MEDFVLDCSVTMAWCFTDESSGETNDLLDSMSHDRRAYAPAVWLLEVANVLLVGERRGRISSRDASRFLTLLWTLPIVSDLDMSPPIMQRILELGRDHEISAYDASYVELAMRRRLPLASLDSRLRAAAEQCAISCLL